MIKFFIGSKDGKILRFGGFSKYKICICNQNGAVFGLLEIKRRRFDPGGMQIFVYCLDQNDVVLISAWTKRRRFDPGGKTIKKGCQSNDVVLISVWSKRRRFDPGGDKKN